jgi:hypothetical protein
MMNWIITIYILQEFATQAESIFKGSDRHTHLDKSYVVLVKVVFEQIDRIASEHSKTPREVVMLGKYLYIYSIRAFYNSTRSCHVR